MSHLYRNLKQVKLAPFQKLYSSTATQSNASNYDVVVVGGGIVGVASARELVQKHDLRMAIVEKESKLAQHQSGHNSGVIHAGIYYQPGSLKAKFCVEGLSLTYNYLDEKNIPYKRCGKLIVATNDVEVKRLKELHVRGTENKVPGLEMIDGKKIKEIEPHCDGLLALHSPYTGIVDWAVVTESYADDFKKLCGDVHLNFEVTDFKAGYDPNYPIRIMSKGGKEIFAKYVLTCGGLYSDKLARMSGCARSPKIIPFRGEYLLLKPSRAHLVKGNIYPCPDPRFPFLGVHFTPRMDGSVWLGPNAVLALSREGYKWSDVNFKELLETLFYPGFMFLGARYAGPGSMEVMKSFCTSMQINDLKKFIPSLTTDDVSSGPAGVRAQALAFNGTLLDDFYFDMSHSPLGKRILHCRNAPSPGATSSLSIAKMIRVKMEELFKL